MNPFMSATDTNIEMVLCVTIALGLWALLNRGFKL